MDTNQKKGAIYIRKSVEVACYAAGVTVALHSHTDFIIMNTLVKVVIWYILSYQRVSKTMFVIAANFLRIIILW